jgi:hypothetical protein
LVGKIRNETVHVGVGEGFFTGGRCDHGYAVAVNLLRMVARGGVWKFGSDEGVVAWG